MSERQLPIILALGTTQTLAWASSYYLPAILADPIARELGVSNNWIFAAFSASLVISGLLGPRIGRQIDIVGGRQVLSISNVTLAVGLVALGVAHSLPVMVAAWLILGIGMGMGLYDAAFGALGRIYGDKARRAITGITLLAGFASTVGWPLTAWGLETIGWRNTCFAWAAAHMVIGLPLNLYFLPKVQGQKIAEGPRVKPHIPIDRTMVLLAIAFASAWAVTGAMAAHLPRILEVDGCHQRAGRHGRRIHRPGAGVCPHRGSQPAEPFPSAGLDAACVHDASSRRLGHRCGRRRRLDRVRAVSWRG